MCKLITKKLWSLKHLVATCAALLLCLATQVNAGSYTASAHGSSNYGVKRSSLTSYGKGNCGHCHAQHTGGSSSLLFSTNFSGKTTNTVPYTADDNVCFQCHQDVSVQTIDSNLTNENYSATFGGASAEVDSILDAFNQNSYHNLYDVQNYIAGSNGERVTPIYDDFPASSNPCSGCHNAHLAKANKRSISTPAETVMSKPSEHEDLWGDDGGTTELMTAFGGDYQPPLYSGSTTFLEPDGLSAIAITQAGKTPNYNALCIDCHNMENTIYSTELGRDLRKFDWSLESHGEGHAYNWTAEDEMLSPYTDTNLGNYVLSCMDCHEPHGSSNGYLIRTSVNAATVSLAVGATSWDALCSNCHLAAANLRNFHHQTRLAAGYLCSDCHVGATKSGIMQPCINCHYHGSSSGGFKTF